jgi:hypothetical protein
MCQLAIRLGYILNISISSSRCNTNYTLGTQSIEFTLLVVFKFVK